MGEGKKMRWTIATARHNLPTLVGLAAREPQDIYRRDKLVARVVSADATEPSRSVQPSAAELLEQIHRACVEDDYELPAIARADRPNAFVTALEERGPTASRRRRKRRT